MLAASLVLVVGSATPPAPTPMPTTVAPPASAALLAGFGAPPVNDEIASAWFATAPMPSSGMRPALMIYFKGPAGWHHTTTGFQSQFLSSPPSIEFKAADLRVLVQYWPQQARARVFGQDLLVGVNKVIVVTDVATPGKEPVARAVSSDVIHVRDGENPALAVLAHSTEARALLGLQR